MLTATQTTSTSPEDRVAAIAYALWLEEGQPSGRAEAHWFKALELVNTDARAVPGAAKPKRKAAAAAAVKKSAPRKRS